MRKIRKGDTVKVMRGKDAGKSAKVEAVILDKKTKKATHVKVEGVNVVKKHVKPNPIINTPGGIFELNKPVAISNVMLVDPNDSKKVTRKRIEKKSKKAAAKKTETKKTDK